MSADHDVTDYQSIRLLEGQVRSLQQRIDQREQALAVLNRRLLSFERSDIGGSGRQRAQQGVVEDSRTESGVEQLRRCEEQLAATRRENDSLRGQINELRATKLFRWAAPVRSVYAKARNAP